MRRLKSPRDPAISSARSQLTRPGPGLPEIAHRLFSELASKGVIGEPLDFGHQAIGMECLDRGNDPPMKLTPPIAQKPMISDVDCERVLEAVFDVWVEAGLLQELCGFEVVEPAA